MDDGLACPPLEDFDLDFNFNETYKLDGFFDDLLFEDEAQEGSIDVGAHCFETNLGEAGPVLSQVMHEEKSNAGTTQVAGGIKKRTYKITLVNKKSDHCYGNFGKGKELKLNLDKKRKIMQADYDSRLEATTHNLRASYDRLREAKQQKRIQHESLLLQQPLLQQEKSPQLEKLKGFKTNPSILNSNRPQKPIVPIQQEQSLPPPHALHAAVTTSTVSNDSTVAP
ncbi:hypothetical protein POM88_008618 [Heracleum sosnowskyi]|uniref:Uncharacterized protein n=1 Tax=Heracleum sosnowskyi TaxID=360622 RepID=A0AAD8JA67_9APIA|nr:hypothetical protein POM88_008618 [Heracleum sosnowskyi]